MALTMTMVDWIAWTSSVIIGSFVATVLVGAVLALTLALLGG
jgi:hypothetical protein